MCNKTNLTPFRKDGKIFSLAPGNNIPNNASSQRKNVDLAGKQWLVRQILSFVKCILSLIFLVLQLSHDAITTSIKLMRHQGGEQQQEHYQLVSTDSSSSSHLLSSSSSLGERQVLGLDQQRNKKRVVVLGGSFAGLAAMRDLNRHSEDLDVLLVDCRDWFEYIPGILRAFCDAPYAPRIIRKRSALPSLSPSSNGVKFGKGFLQATAKRIEKNRVIVSPTGSGCMEDSTIAVPFDFLLVATGSNYKHPITPSGTAASNYNERLRSFEEEEKNIRNANSILILGGGPVGVELAAEIICHFPFKSVTIIQGKDKLLPSFPTKTSAYAEKWLHQRNVNVLLNTRLSSYNEKDCKTTSGEIHSADLMYVCFGMKPNSDVVSASKIQNDSLIDQNGFVLVKDTFQIQESKNKNGASNENIFVIGDAASHPYSEMKQAYYAEAHGHVVAKNIIAMANNISSSATSPTTPPPPIMPRISGCANNASLKPYPEGFTGHKGDEMPLVYVVSLGRYDGSLGINNFVLNDPLASLVKWIIEYTKVMQMDGKAVGEYIWWFGDKLTLWISRHILNPSPAQK